MLTECIDCIPRLDLSISILCVTTFNVTSPKPPPSSPSSLLLLLLLPERERKRETDRENNNKKNLVQSLNPHSLPFGHEG